MLIYGMDTIRRRPQLTLHFKLKHHLRKNMNDMTSKKYVCTYRYICKRDVVWENVLGVGVLWDECGFDGGKRKASISWFLISDEPAKKQSRKHYYCIVLCIPASLFASFFILHSFLCSGQLLFIDIVNCHPWSRSRRSSSRLGLFWREFYAYLDKLLVHI